jgi:RNA polymerase sigma factor (sigma-70 family)
MTQPPDPQLTAFITEQYPSLRRFFGRRGLSVSDVHDLCQNTMLTFVEKHHTGVENPRAFLFGIARLKLLQFWDGKKRAGDRNHEFDSRQVSIAVLTSSLGIKIARATWIRGTLDDLPSRQLDALHLRYCEGLTADEAATALEVDRSTLNRWVREAVATLREKLPASDAHATDDALIAKVRDDYGA